MVPGVNDAAAHMFPLGRCLLRTGGLLDIDRELGFGSRRKGNRLAPVHIRFRYNRWACGGGTGRNGDGALGVVKTANSCHRHDVNAQLAPLRKEALGCRGLLDVYFVSIGIGAKRDSTGQANWSAQGMFNESRKRKSGRS